MEQQDIHPTLTAHLREAFAARKLSQVPILPEIEQFLEEMDHDPTPWCLGCGSMTQKGCDCGPIAAND